MDVSRYRRLLRAVLLSAGPLACSSGTTDMPERVACVDVRPPSRYRGLTLSPGIDGIVLATRGSELVDTDPTSRPPATRIEALGTPCARASDRVACAARVEALLTGDGPEWDVSVRSCGGCERERLVDRAVVTAGDDVRSATLDDVIAAAAPIETRDEAATVMALRSRFFDCDDENVRTEADGWTFKATSSSCDGSKSERFLRVSRLGVVTDGGKRIVDEGSGGCIEGRRPTGLATTAAAWLDSLAACFGEIAMMEAASVLAFEALENDLRTLGAPENLLVRARAARSDEVAHARVTAALARAFGAVPKAPCLENAPDVAVTALEVARANVVEGCVREAYGALVAAWQAAHASSPDVRAAFAKIARDEARHAELSFAIDAWVTGRLTIDERRQVREARERAWAQLEADVREPAGDVVRVAGMPTAREALALLDDLRSVAAAA